MEKKRVASRAILMPMPIVLVGTIYEGRANFMTVAWANKAHGNPPMMMLSINKRHATWDAIMANKEFSVNVANVEMMERADYCGLAGGKENDKSPVFELFQGELDQAPLIQDAPLSFECKLYTTCDLPVDTIFVGEVIHAYSDDRYCTNGEPDIAKMDPLVYNSPGKMYYNVGQYQGPAWSIGKSYRTK